jgi:hypothetical protein
MDVWVVDVGLLGCVFVVVLGSSRVVCNDISWQVVDIRGIIC